jgi:hypothetical protein
VLRDTSFDFACYTTGLTRNMLQRLCLFNLWDFRSQFVFARNSVTTYQHRFRQPAWINTALSRRVLTVWHADTLLKFVEANSFLSHAVCNSCQQTNVTPQAASFNSKPYYSSEIELCKVGVHGKRVRCGACVLPKQIIRKCRRQWREVCAKDPYGAVVYSEWPWRMHECHLDFGGRGG